MINNDSMIHTLLPQVLALLGSPQPTPEQLRLAKRLLLRTTLSRELLFNPRLSAKEIECLLLAARGFSARESAELLGIKLSTVDSCRKEVKRKLKCKTLPQAIYEGICFGYIQPDYEDTPNLGYSRITQ